MAALSTDSYTNGRTSPSRTRGNDNVGLGELLRRTRVDRGLTLEQISNETKIPRRHLEALEHDNVAAVPGEFYRRAEIRAYARAIRLDQNIALAELERAETPSVVSRAIVERPKASRFPTRELIAIGVVIAAALIGRANWGREPDLASHAQTRITTGSPVHSVTLVRETPLDAAVAPTSPPSDASPAVAMEPAGARASAAANGDLAVTPKQDGDARISADTGTELVVTTQPAGARVTVNGIGWGIAPVTIRYLPAGQKRIRATKEGYTPAERMVRVAEGYPTMVNIQLRSSP